MWGVFSKPYCTAMILHSAMDTEKGVMKISHQYIAETSDVEFKLQLEQRDPRSWMKTVSAFANGEGGSLVFGVADDGSPIGIEDPQSAIERISELIKTRIDPIIVPNIRTIEIEGKHIVEVRVPSGVKTPYFYRGHNGDLTAYRRMGSQSVAVPMDMLAELILKGQNRTYDAMATEFRADEYRFALLEDNFKDARGNSLDLSRDLASMGLVTGAGMLTVAGALLADRSPIFQSRIFCTRWNGLTKSGGPDGDALDKDEFQGSILGMLDDALKFIRHNSSIRWTKTGNGRQEYPDYPSVAVHEALVNAIVHRDYSIQGSEIHIDMYDDRLEIVSPGGMYSGKFIQDLDVNDIASTRRNPVLCDVLGRLELMERLGSGLNKIVTSYPEGQPPTFRSSETDFTSVLPNLNAGRILEPSETDNETVLDTDDILWTVYAAIKNDPKATYIQIALAASLSRSSTGRAISRLRDLGYIQRMGSNRAGYWELNRAYPSLSPDSDGDTDDSDHDSDRATDIVRTAILSNSQITYSQIAEETKLSSSSVARAIRQLKREGRLQRIGTTKSGHWEVIDLP